MFCFVTDTATDCLHDPGQTTKSFPICTTAQQSIHPSFSPSSQGFWQSKLSGPESDSFWMCLQNSNICNIGEAQTYRQTLGNCLPRVDCDFWSKYVKSKGFSVCFLPFFLPSSSGKKWLGGSLDKSMKLTPNKWPFLCLVSTCQPQECYHNWTERFKARLFIREQTIILET